MCTVELHSSWILQVALEPRVVYWSSHTTSCLHLVVAFESCAVFPPSQSTMSIIALCCICTIASTHEYALIVFWSSHLQHIISNITVRCLFHHCNPPYPALHFVMFATIAINHVICNSALPTLCIISFCETPKH